MVDLARLVMVCRDRVNVSFGAVGLGVSVNRPLGAGASWGFDVVYRVHNLGTKVLVRSLSCLHKEGHPDLSKIPGCLLRCAIDNL